MITMLITIGDARLALNLPITLHRDPKTQACCGDTQESETAEESHEDIPAKLGGQIQEIQGPGHVGDVY
jgi:hypothetical protein